MHLAGSIELTACLIVLLGGSPSAVVRFAAQQKLLSWKVLCDMVVELTATVP